MVKKEQRLNYMRLWAKNNRSKLRKYQKERSLLARDLVLKNKEKPCKDCGQHYPYFIMEFDHVKGDKKFTLSTATSGGRSLKSIQEEIDKCEVVCANCHRIRSYKKKQCNYT